MPEGLQYVLSAKLSETPRISVISYDSGPSLIIEKCMQEAIFNCLEICEGSKAHVHLVLFSCDVTNFNLPSQCVSDDVALYDFVRNPCDNIEKLYEGIMKNVVSKPGKSHILLIDDYSLFSIMCGSRDSRRQSHFIHLISPRFRKLFLFFHKESLSKEEIGMIYDISSDIAFLQLHPDSYGPGCGGSSKFVCDLLKIRADRRVTHDKSVFQVTSCDEFKEEMVHESSDKSGNGSSSSDVLKNLTTFKLTLEEDERESKNNLHLPYFEAQKTSLEDPVNYDEFEDDEEDEEI